MRVSAGEDRNAKRSGNEACRPHGAMRNEPGRVTMPQRSDGPSSHDQDPTVHGGYFMIDESAAADIADSIRRSDPGSCANYAAPLPDLFADAETFSDFFSAAAAAGWAGPLMPGVALLLESGHRWVNSEAASTDELVDVLTWLSPHDVRDLVRTAACVIADLQRRIAIAPFAAAAKATSDEDAARYWRSETFEAVDRAAAAEERAQSAGSN
jgi:hypothetical protein